MRGLGVYTGLMKHRIETGGAPVYIPSMDFSKPRNSMYVAVISAFCG